MTLWACSLNVSAYICIHFLDFVVPGSESVDDVEELAEEDGWGNFSIFILVQDSDQMLK